MSMSEDRGFAIYESKTVRFTRKAIEEEVGDSAKQPKEVSSFIFGYAAFC